MKVWLKALALEAIIAVSGGVFAGVKETEAFNFAPLGYALLAMGVVSLIVTGVAFLTEVLYD